GPDEPRPVRGPDEVGVDPTRRRVVERHRLAVAEEPQLAEAHRQVERAVDGHRRGGRGTQVDGIGTAPGREAERDEKERAHGASASTAKARAGDGDGPCEPAREVATTLIVLRNKIGGPLARII